VLPLDNTAQVTRASLWATATITTLRCALASKKATRRAMRSGTRRVAGTSGCAGEVYCCSAARRQEDAWCCSVLNGQTRLGATDGGGRPDRVKRCGHLGPTIYSITTAAGRPKSEVAGLRPEARLALLGSLYHQHPQSVELFYIAPLRMLYRPTLFEGILQSTPGHPFQG